MDFHVIFFCALILKHGNECFGFVEHDFLQFLINLRVDVKSSCSEKILFSTNKDNTTSNTNIANSRVKFVDFITEYDKRRNTSFLEAFPEMQEFFDVCLLEKQKQLDE